MKLCINCKHCVIAADDLKKYARCGYNAPVSLVTGESEVHELWYCNVIRESENPNKCGAEGRFYEEKTNV